MGLDAKKHTSFAAGEAPTRAALAAALFSIDDIIPVATATEAGQVATAVAAAGQTLATNPVFVSRADARGLHRIEYSYDGTVWIPFSGILEFASTGDRDTWTSANSAYLSVADRCIVGGVTYGWSGSSWLRVVDSAKYIARAAPSGVASSPTLAVITGLSVVVDNGAFTYSTGVFTCVIAGRYDLTLVVGWAANATGTRRARMVVAGSTSVTRTFEVASNAINATVDCTADPKIIGIALQAGDTVTVQQQQSSGGSLSLSPEVELERVG